MRYFSLPKRELLGSPKVGESPTDMGNHVRQKSGEDSHNNVACFAPASLKTSSGGGEQRYTLSAKKGKRRKSEIWERREGKIRPRHPR